MTLDRRKVLAGSGAAALVAGGAATWYGVRRMGSMDDYNAFVSAQRRVLSEQPEMLDFIRYATLAANGHNTQPWRFRVAENAIEVLPDFSRRTPIVDPDDHHLFASLGCAAENLALAAEARSRRATIRFQPAHDGSVVVALERGPSASTDLFDAIPRRQSTRAEFDGRPVSVADLNALKAASAVQGVDVALIVDRTQIDRVRDLVVAGNSAQMGDPAFLRELKDWLRFSPRQAMRAGDGLFAASSGNPVLPPWLGSPLFDWVFRADAENEKYAKQLRSSAGVAVFVAARDDPEHWMLAGRACQRFALQAAALGLKNSFINQPAEVVALRPELATLVGLPGRRPDIVMRLGYGPTLPYSPRRRVSTVLA